MLFSPPTPIFYLLQFSPLQQLSIIFVFHLEIKVRYTCIAVLARVKSLELTISINPLIEMEKRAKA